MEKQAYTKPETEITWMNGQTAMLASTMIPVGGEGGFDVKEENVWETESEATEDSYDFAF